MAWKGMFFGALIGFLLTAQRLGSGDRRHHRLMLDPEQGRRGLRPPERMRRGSISRGILSHHLRDHGPRREIRRPRIGGGNRRGAALMQELQLGARARSAPRSPVSEPESPPATMRAWRRAPARGLRPALRPAARIHGAAAARGAGRQRHLAARAQHPGCALPSGSGMSGLEFARMEASLRARQGNGFQRARRPGERWPNAMRSSRCGAGISDAGGHQGLPAPDEPAPS